MKSFISLALPFLTTLSLISASPTPRENDHPTKNSLAHYYKSPNEAFQDLLNALPEESLHAALVSSLTHFREGIFESDRHGVEHIHHDNPPLATKLIVAAVEDLKNKKRQVSNGTMTPKAPEQTKSTLPAVLVPVQITTTDAQGRSTTASQEVLSAATASVAIAVTTTNAAGQATVSTATKPAVVQSTTNAAGSVVLTTSAIEPAPTIGQVLTTTNGQGSAFVTTFTPDGGRVSSIVLQTTTGADGKPTVVTSYTYVDPASATRAPSASGTHTGKPGLQSNAAGRSRAVDVALAGGFWAGVLALV